MALILGWVRNEIRRLFLSGRRGPGRPGRAGGRCGASYLSRCTLTPWGSLWHALGGFGRNREFYEAVKKPSGTHQGAFHALVYNGETTK